jgi:hypothetical protein
MQDRLPPLTTALEDRDSPVRQFLDERFANWRSVQRDYRDAVGPIAVTGSTVNPGTLGAAFDWLIRFLVNPHPDLHLAAQGAAVSRSPGTAKALREMASLLGFPAGHGPGGAPGKMFEGPMRGSAVEPDLLARGCWVLALFTEVTRVGLRPGSPLRDIDPAPRATDLLALAPDAAVRQLTLLRGAAEDVLLPLLSTRNGRWTLGPTFDGSVLMSADADLIASGLMLEIKTSPGRKREDGTRRAILDRRTILQLLGYTLMDFCDKYGITELGVFSARYKHLATWDAGALLDELADRHVDLSAERADFRDLLVSMKAMPRGVRG